MPDLKLSAVLNLVDDPRAIRRTLASLAAQTAKQHLEVVIVTTKQAAARIDRAELEAFGGYQIVEVDALPTGAAGWAAGVRVVRSPLVVMCEDHSFPEPNWAQTLLDAHSRDQYFAVTPQVRNGNPATRASWANFLLSFVEWYDPPQTMEVEVGAGHNTCYRREMLLKDYGADLETWLNPERVMHVHARSQGRKILLEARTWVEHVNISETRSYFFMSYAGGRVFGAARAANWPLGRRIVYSLLFPLVPFIRLRRLWGALNSPQKRSKARFWPSLPLIVPGLFYHAFGEAVGYLFGEGGISPTYGLYELRRRDYVIPGERAWLLEEG